MKPQPKTAKPPPGNSKPAPNFGTPDEKTAHEKLDPDHHHGGRTQTPDKDVNPADALHVKEKDVSPTPKNSEVTRRNPPTKDVKQQRGPRKGESV